jgi:hypothetical protein
MNQKPSDPDNEDESKKLNVNDNTNFPTQYPAVNMFVPPPGFAMAPPGYPYYAQSPW